MEKQCGSCKSWEPSSQGSPWGWCHYEIFVNVKLIVPEWVDLSKDAAGRDCEATDGAMCLTYKPLEVARG